MPTGSICSTRRRRAPLVVSLLVSLLAVGLSPAGAQAAVPAPTGLSPNAESVTGIPVLQWDRVTGAKSYTVEVSTSASFDSKLWTTSTTNRKATPTRQLPGQTIFWRVRTNGDAGSSDWADAAIDHNALAGPTPVGPPSGTVLQQPQEPALVSWTPVTGAKSYTLQVSTDSSFTDDSLTDTFPTQTTSIVVPNPQVAQLYYWRVRATFDTGILSEWSTVRNYEIGGLSKPVLVSPEDGPSTDVEDIVLDWEAVLGAKTYNVQVSTDQNFSDTLLDVNAVGVVGTRYSPPVTLANDTYYWRVQPVDASGNKLDWGSVETWQFRRHWPDQPSLEYPADNAVVGDPFHYQWTPVHLAAEYTIQLSTTSDFGTLADQCTTVHTTFVPTSRTDCHPTALGTYYWRVIATDTPGQTRDHDDIVTDAINADVHRFTYDPAVPTLLSPAPAETVEVPTLRWSPVTGADSYRVTVTAVSDGDGGGTFTTTGTSYTPRAQLTAGKTYRWQVQALSASTRVGTGLTTGSQPTFTVAAATATPGSTPEPAGSPAPSSRFPTLSWSPVTDATGYKILVRPVGSIAWTPLADKFSYPAGEDDTEVWLSPGTYEWYVESYLGSVYQSSSTTTSTFTITSLAPVTGRKVAMTGQALADNATTCATALPERCMDLRHTPVLHWADDPDVGSYKVYLARDEEMTNVLSGYPIRVESTSFIPVSALPDSQAGSAYYWFVQPCKTKTVCAPLAHATNAFNKLSKPVELLSPGVDETRANDITFTWRDYLETNQNPAAFPLTDPSGVHDVAPRVEARQYRIQVSTDANFQSWIDQVTVDQTTFTSATNTYPEGPLFWRVQAIDASGNQLSWSAGSKFFKSSPRVTLLEPLGDMEVSGSVPLRWEPLAYAASYDVQVFRNGDTTGSETNKVDEGNSKQAAIGWTVPMAVSPAPYTWRVRPVDAKGRPGRWTDLDDPNARFYVTGESPVLFDPATDVYVHANDALFTWEGVAGAASYRFERRKVGSASSAESVVTAALAWAPVSLITDGHWQWRVSSLDTAGKVLGSSEWRGFVVDGTPPAVTSYAPQGKVGPTANFVVKFSEPVSTVNNKTFKLTVSGTTTTLLATVTLNAAGTKATLNPTASLKSGKKYTLKLTKGVRDPAGNRLQAMSWQVTAR